MSGDNTPIPPSSSSSSSTQPKRSSPLNNNNNNNNNSGNDIESSPIYQALSSRLTRTETALSTLSAQVSQLTNIVKTLAPNNGIPQSTTSPVRPKNTTTSTVTTTSVFAPFDSELPIPSSSISAPGIKQNGLPKSPFIPSTTPQPQASVGGGTANPEIAALTQQISALSTSVAQLQRLQSQNQVTRAGSSNSSVPTLSSLALAGERHPGGTPGAGGLGGQMSLGIPTRPIHQGVEDLIASNGPMTTPSNSSHHPQQSQGNFGGVNRPNINRSFSSGIIGQPQPEFALASSISTSTTSRLPGGGAHSHGHPHGHPHTPSGLRSESQREWPGNLNVVSPGPGQIPPPTGPTTPGGSGLAAPGAGIVITKWEHLNLKVDLLRSISKYGIGPPNKIQTRVLPFMIKGSDIIAQAPPTTERIISYVIPALHLVQNLPPPPATYAGPAVIIITTTVDQAMQCQKLVRGVGGPIGIRSGVAAGAAGSSGLPNEIAAFQRDAIHILIGTPAKVAEVMTSRGGLAGSECRLLILDEVDQLIARNLYDNVLNIAKLLPAPRRGAGGSSMTGPLTPSAPIAPFSPGLTSPYDAGRDSPFNPASKTPFPSQGSRFGAPATTNGTAAVGGPTAPTAGLGGAGGGNAIERQTCLFSNTIPTDVINFSQSLNVRDPVRVLVRREGGTNSQESVSSVTPGINLKHTYVYLTITGSAQAGATQQAGNGDPGPGTIGSGRNTSGQNEEQSRAKEYKLEMLVKMLEDYPLWQAIVHVGTYSMLEAVVLRLQSRKWETLYLTPEMPPNQKKAILQQWRISLSGNGPRFLVVFDVNIKPPEVPWSPLVINFDLPRSVEGYAHRAAAAVPPITRQGPQVNGVIVSFVQAAGGDVEMLRSTECAYRFKSAEIPSVFHDLFNH
ncbi:uncharacterized protein I303_103388 [Kwoniella dejecticola CBS 10117]|uniref:RNA helicase n=1 Tax=Kwoniella dejecticola CBS 10117 TaxID=1296121 RepID=A0A1A6A6L8_9TREE|nr:uncharacterized protein I303_03411 [Kwoniella dejecticola CBS 10117]OBR85700.1 hypothetical protein I303_03411 [Kwoniella dejecticola CBS 10117]